jgi:hypothetical protein
MDNYKQLKKRKWIIKDGNKETIVEGLTERGVLGVYYKVGRFGLGKDWQFTKLKTGWIIAADASEKPFYRRKIKLKEIV